MSPALKSLELVLFKQGSQEQVSRVRVSRLMELSEAHHPRLTMQIFPGLNLRSLPALMSLSEAHLLTENASRDDQGRTGRRNVQRAR